MLHFPSKLQSSGPNGAPKRSDSLNLNATQQKPASHPIFLKIEEELHDARRVHSHGQEDDLRYALDMVINRVADLSSLLSEAYKTQADLEVQLNVAKSNLQLVIANNEMLEDALKRDTSGQSKNVGWRRTSGREGDGRDPRSSVERSHSLDYSPPSAELSPPPSAGTPPPSAVVSATPDNRFFKFRFNNTPTTQRPATRPSTPLGSANLNTLHHLTSPSMPSLPTISKELEDLNAQLEKERAAKKKIADEKAALEEELEALSQALFEEANHMVASERKRRAETEEELKEIREEKEALKSALRLIEGENSHLRETTYIPPSPSDLESFQSRSSESRTHSRSSSQIAIKSRPASLDLPLSLPPLPPSPFPDGSTHTDRTEMDLPTRIIRDAKDRSFSPEEDAFPTPKFRPSLPPTPAPQDALFADASPWADVPPKGNTPGFSALFSTIATRRA